MPVKYHYKLQWRHGVEKQETTLKGPWELDIAIKGLLENGILFTNISVFIVLGALPPEKAMAV